MLSYSYEFEPAFIACVLDEAYKGNIVICIWSIHMDIIYYPNGTGI
jgi:hypothetical protein